MNQSDKTVKDYLDEAQAIIDHLKAEKDLKSIRLSPNTDVELSGLALAKGLRDILLAYKNGEYDIIETYEPQKK